MKCELCRLRCRRLELRKGNILPRAGLLLNHRPYRMGKSFRCGCSSFRAYYNKHIHCLPYMISLILPLKSTFKTVYNKWYNFFQFSLQIYFKKFTFNRFLMIFFFIIIISLIYLHCYSVFYL